MHTNVIGPFLKNYVSKPKGGKNSAFSRYDENGVNLTKLMIDLWFFKNIQSILDLVDCSVTPKLFTKSSFSLNQVSFI